MKKAMSIRLLTKISIFFLLFTAVFFVLSATLLVSSIENRINDNVEHVFMHKREEVIETISSGNNISILNVEYEEVENYTDGVLMRKDTILLGKNSYYHHLYRLQNEVITINETQYLLKMRLNIDEILWLKVDMIDDLLLIFGSMVIAIIVFNIAISSYLLRPFRAILQQMNRFRVGEFMPIEKVNTNTQEFIELQEPFHRMLRQAEEDYRNLKEYTENMAHEFQTPLAIIRNKTEMLIGDNIVMNQQASPVKAIYDETNHMSKLGSRLRLLTKIENHEFMNREVITTFHIIQNHVENLSELAGLKDLKIDLFLDEQHSLEIDPILLDIVIKNLLRNAILYATPATNIAVETTDSYFSISNEGEMMKDNGRRLFKRFARGNTSSTSLGLGLAIVRKICDQNNLIINYSYQGKHHTFKITKI